MGERGDGFRWFIGRIRETLSVVSGGGGDSVSRVKVQGDSVNVKVKEKKERAKLPYRHVWLQRSEDNQRFLHPLESRSVLDFVDKDIGDVEPVKPTSLEETPFKLLEEVKDLKSCMEQIWLLYGFNETLAYIFAMCFILDRVDQSTHCRYQNADWRLRPLPDEMLSADTPLGVRKPDASLIEAYKRSYDKCMEVYEKEFLTENSYLYIYGLQGTELNAQ
ncbi:hypothetical protein Patl1_22785 [Pistacia atlantica]|uniref:Uncharacterized protein n=1 Tax=Pistacia atlantica TaxID=434234 RepID=A0ACC0ZY08_9ROSI|nr:hypothetical protein Patl1_22785 [Pistacia atlantica]